MMVIMLYLTSLTKQAHVTEEPVNPEQDIMTHIHDIGSGIHQLLDTGVPCRHRNFLNQLQIL